MTPIELAEKLSLKIIHPGEGKIRTVSGVYCCDLLSIVMGKAKEDNAWITVMGNVNSIAVAVLADVSCIILSENAQMDLDGLAKARGQNVCVLASERSTYEIAIGIHQAELG